MPVSRRIALLLLLLLPLLTAPRADAAGTARLQSAPAAEQPLSAKLVKAEPRNGGRDFRGLSLTFDRAVQAEEVRRVLRFDPGIGRYSLLPGATAQEVVVRGSFRAGRPYRLLLVDPAAPRDAAPLHEARFAGPGPAAALDFAGDRRTVERRGRQLFPLRVNNIQRIAATLYAQPPLFAVDPLRFADGSTVAVDLYRRARAFDASLAPLKGAPEFAPFLPFLPADFYAGTTECRESFFLPPDAASDDHGYFVFGLPLSFRSAPGRAVLGLLSLEGHGPAETLELEGMVRVTDLALAYKRAAGSLLLWATSLHEARPVAGAQVLLIRRDDARIAAGAVDGDGLLLLHSGATLPVLLRDGESFRVEAQPLDPASVVAAVAVAGEDVAWQSLAAQRLVHAAHPAREGTFEIDARNVGIFTERGVYRPGEQVLFKGCARAWIDGRVAPPEGESYRVSAVDPDGKEIHAETLAAGEFGGFSGTIEIAGHAKLGQHSLRVIEGAPAEGATGKTLAEVGFAVQEYERPRHFVTVTFSETAGPLPGYVGVEAAGRRLEALVKPAYYAGGTLKHAKVRWRAALVPVAATRAEEPGFRFGDDGEEEFLLESGETFTDERGEARVALPLERDQFDGLRGVRVSATAVDIDGRAATGVETFKPAPRFAVGIADPPANLSSGDTCTFRAIVLDETGKRIPAGKLRVAVQRTDWFYALKRSDNGEVTYSWDEYWVDQQDGEAELVDGVAAYRITASTSGSWRVRFAYGDGAETSAAQARFTVDWAGSDNFEDESGVTRQDVMKAQQLVLFPSRRAARPGDEVTVELHARRPVSHCLVTVERDGILSARVLPAGGRDFAFPVKIDAAHRPNVFVGVIALAPRLRYPVHGYQTDAEAPAAFFGVERIEVRDDGGGLRVEVAPGTPELKARPGETVSVAVVTLDRDGAPARTEVALAVVDEAVLSITRFRTPSFAALARFLLPLSVVAGEGRFDLVAQDAFRLASVDPLTGGDGGGAYDSIALRKDFRPVAFFHPALRTDENGRAEVAFALPDSTTTYRVYAIACDRGSGFGAAEKPLLVTKEFRVDPMLPRFLTLGDRFRFPLALFNRGAADGRASFELSSDPAVGLSPEATEATVPALGRAEVAVDGEARAVAASAAVVVKARMGGETDGVEVARPVHAPWLRLRRNLSGDLTGEGAEGSRVAVDQLDEIGKLPADALAADPPTARITLSRSLWSRVAPGLAYLLEYPYGCIEQTSSRVIPLAGLRSLAAKGHIATPTVAEIDLRIKTGVERIYAMRAEGGGFAYWPGGREANYGGTLYALLALSLAREAGYPVPPDAFAPACKYVREQAAQNRFGGWHPFGIDGLSALALALNGELKPDEVDAFAGAWKDLESDGRALHLLAALKAHPAQAGALRKKLLDANPVGTVPKLERHLKYRAAALWLMAARALDAKIVADKLASLLIDALGREGRLRSTADTGLALLAVADWLAARPPESDKPVAVTVAQAEGGARSFELPAKGEIALPLDFAALVAKGGVDVAIDPPALVHYSLEVASPDLFAGDVPVDRGVGLTRAIEPMGGSGPIRVGDIVKVSLRLALPHGARERWREFEFLAIEDPLPAGFEAINSALPAEEDPREDETRDENYYWRDGFYDLVPDHAEYRDDRVLVFRDSLWSGDFRFEYYARAICAGTFKLRPARAHFMYDPDRYGIAPGGEVRIEPAR